MLKGTYIIIHADGSRVDTTFISCFVQRCGYKGKKKRCIRYIDRSIQHSSYFSGTMTLGAQLHTRPPYPSLYFLGNPW